MFCSITSDLHTRFLAQMEKITVINLINISQQMLPNTNAYMEQKCNSACS